MSDMFPDAKPCTCESLHVGMHVSDCMYYVACNQQQVSGREQRRRNSGSGGEIVWNLRVVCGECGGGVVQGGEGGVLLVVWCVRW